MKHKTTVLLGALVLANAGLWAAYWQRGETPPATATVPATPPVVAPPPPPAPAKVDWAQLESEDPATFAANLRGVGVPEPTVRLLVAGMLRERYLARQRELLGPNDPSLDGSAALTPANREKLVALRTLAREQQELLRTLCGGDESNQALRERQRQQYGVLPDGQLDQLDSIHANYDEMAAEIHRKAGGLLLPAEREALELLEQEKRKDIAALLTPAELEVFDLSTSPLGRTLRNRLLAFAPSEQEFRAIFRLQRAFDEKFNRPPGSGFTEARAPERTAAEQELAAGLRRALGEARFTEYSKHQDNDYRMAVRLAERFGLPAGRAEAVYTLAQQTHARLQVLRNDRELSPEAALLALTALNREANEKLATLLGADGAEAYKLTSGGAWLRTMDRVARANTAVSSPESSAAAISAAAPSAIAAAAVVPGILAPAATVAAEPSSATTVEHEKPVTAPAPGG